MPLTMQHLYSWHYIYLNHAQIILDELLPFKRLYNLKGVVLTFAINNYVFNLKVISHLALNRMHGFPTVFALL